MLMNVDDAKTDPKIANPAPKASPSGLDSASKKADEKQDKAKKEASTD